ncbi:MAG: hypothetical protein U1D30_05720 [Planctomycetota bacterium]
MAWNKDFSRLVSGSSNGSVFLWKPDLAKEKSLEGAGEAIYAVAIQPEGTLAAAGTWNGLVCIWNTATGKLLATLLSADRPDDQPLDWMLLTQSGYYACSPTMAERFRWQMSGQPLPADRVAESMNKPDQVIKILSGAEPAKIEFTAPPENSP